MAHKTEPWLAGKFFWPKGLELFGLLLAFLAIFPANAALAANPEGKMEKAQTAQVGELAISLLAPEGFSRLEGLSPEADAFLAFLSEKFKLRILAIYGDPEEWLSFSEAVSKGDFRAPPSLALVVSTIKMNQRTYAAKAISKEINRLSNLFSLASNTPPLARLFSSRANKKIREKLGRDIGFSYDTGENTRKYWEGPSSISFGALITLRYNRGGSDIFVSASALNVADKLIYIGLVGGDRSPVGIARQKERTQAWLETMARANPPAPELILAQNPPESELR
jgi:hypothetical protein